MRGLLISIIALTLTGCGLSGLMKKGGPINPPASSSIPVEYKRKLLHSEVKVNGVKKRFVFDTGAPCVVSPELKEELGLKTVARHGIRDSQGQAEQLEFVRLGSFKVGEVEFKNLIAVVIDLSKLKCYDLDGLIGANAMRHLDWYFDLKAEEAIAYQRDVLDSLRTDRSFTIDFDPNVQFTPKVEVYLKGMKGPIDASFDMGSTGSVSLKGDLGGLSKSFEERTWVYGKVSRGVFGTRSDTTHYFLAPEVEIGGGLFHDQLVKGSRSNLIGNSLLQDQKFLLSYRHNKVLFDPKEVQEQTLPTSRILIGEDQDSLRVMGIREAGVDLPLAIDDVILSINGEQMNELSEMELCALHTREWPILDMRILKADGSILELQLPRAAVFKHPNDEDQDTDPE